MTDVRLTATNPEDSSVVPVACNDKGELKLEEPITFDGNLDRDLTVSGTASDTKIVLKATDGNITASGSLLCGDTTFESAYAYLDPDAGIALMADINTPMINLSSADGSATFEGSITSDGSIQVSEGISSADGYGTVMNEVGFAARNDSASASYIFRGYKGGVTPANQTININNDGSAEYATGKAGFTKEGYLWCTTRRGDTVILDATQGGIGAWADYTPPTRTTLKDKLETLRDESATISQDLPETPTETQ